MPGKSLLFVVNTSYATRDHLISLSLQTLGARLWANSLVIAFGLLAMASNSLLLVIISKSKTLHTKCFALIAANAVVDFLLGLAYAITNAKRIYRYSEEIGEVMTTWTCFCEVSVNAFVQVLSLAMTAALVVDRSIAIIRPLIYFHLNFKKLTLPLICCAFFYSFLQFLANLHNSYTGPEEPTVFNCGIDDSVSDGMLIALMSIQIATSVGVVALNCALAVVIKLKQKARESESSPSEREAKVFKSITVTVLIHIFVYLGGRLCILVAPLFLDDMTVSLTNRYMRDLVVVSASVNFLIHYATSSEFRIAAKKLFCFKSATVAPALQA